MMRKVLSCVCLVTAIGLAGCGYTPEQRATSGGLIGAGTGASVAALAGGGPGAVIAGTLLGGGAGALIGANTRPPPPPPPPVVVARRCAEFVEDPYGGRHCRAYYAY